LYIVSDESDDDANEKEDIIPANEDDEDVDKSKLYEELANDVVGLLRSC